MKTLSTFLVLLITVASFGQIGYQNSAIPTITVGELIELRLVAGNNDKNFLNDKKFEVRIGKSIITPSNYELKAIDDVNFLLRFDYPLEMGLSGKEKNLVLTDGLKSYPLKINIYSEPPVTKSIRSSNAQNSSSTIFYNDVNDYQDIIIEVDNVLKIKKITFSDTRVQIKGVAGNEIEYTNSDLKTDVVSNLIYLKVNLKDAQNLNFKMEYTNSSLLDTITREQTDKDVNLAAKYPGGAMTATPKTFYADDFNIESAAPEIILDLSPKGIKQTEYIFTIVNDVSGTNSTSKDLKIIDGSSNSAKYAGNTIKASLPSTIATGRHIVRAAPNGYVANALFSEIFVFPQPAISGVVVRNAINNNELVRKKGNMYTITLRGQKLHQMTDLSFYLVCKTNPSVQVYKLLADGSIVEDAKNLNLAFGDDNFKNIDAGDYEIRVSRPVAGGFEKIYLNDYVIKVVHPKFIASDQVQAKYIGLSKTAEYFESKAFFKRDTLKIEKRKLLQPYSPIILKIQASPKIAENGPQYLSVDAVYYQSNGNKSTITWTEGDSNSLIIKENQEVTFNLKAAFNLQDIEELNVGEKIVVSVKHSPNIYGKSNTEEKQTFIYHRRDSFLERLGFTASLPPYIAVGRRVSKKTVTKDDQGNITNVTFDTGSKKFQMQNLLLNAGIGFKFRFKKDNYEPSNFALGAYAMGMNFADSDNSDDQLNDPKNTDFVKNRSFNAMLLGEFNLANLDAINTKIPVYLGTAYILDPIDSGSKLALVFGLGIDISIAD